MWNNEINKLFFKWWKIWNNIDGPRDGHTKWSESERERQIPRDITCMWNLSYDTNKFMKQKDS